MRRGDPIDSENIWPWYFLFRKNSVQVSTGDRKPIFRYCCAVFLTNQLNFVLQPRTSRIQFLGVRWFNYWNGSGQLVLAIPSFKIRLWRRPNNLFLKEFQKTLRTRLLLHFSDIFCLTLMLPVIWSIFCFRKTNQFPKYDLNFWIFSRILRT